MNIRKTIGSLIVGLFLIVVLNWMYSSFLYESDLKKYAPEIHRFLKKAEHANIIYLSDHSDENRHLNNGVRSKNSVDYLLGDKILKNQLATYKSNFADISLFKDLLKSIKNTSPNQTIIIPLNLRYFGSEWQYSAKKTNNEKKIELIKDRPFLINKLLFAFTTPEVDNSLINKSLKEEWKRISFDTLNNFTYPSVYEWDRGMSLSGYRDSNGNYDHELTSRACHYIKSYAFSVDEDENTSLFKDFNEIIELVKKNDWKLIFHILPQNTNEAGALCGYELFNLIQNNHDLLVAKFSSAEFILIDNFYLDESHFSKDNLPGENYNEKSIRAISSSLIDALSEIYGSEIFKEKSSSMYLEFVVDCENESSEYIETHLSRRFAFSGDYSSRINSKTPYSISFEKRLELDELSGFNKMDVEFMLRGKVHNDKAKLVLEFIPENKASKIWQGIELSKLTKSESSEWIKYQNSYKMEVIPKERGTLKLYIINDFKVPLYIDDLKVRFK